MLSDWFISDDIWRYRAWSAMVKLMTWYPTAPTIALTNADLSLNELYGVPQEVAMNLIGSMCSDITILALYVLNFSE